MKKYKSLIVFLTIFVITNIIACTSYNVKAEDSTNNSQTPTISYRTHVQNIGWQEWKNNGEMAGTSGQSLRLEAMNIKLQNNGEIKLKYQVHVQNIGWQGWKNNGEMAGTSGQSLRLEAIKIELENTEDYSVMYRVHVQDIGWQSWKTDGEMAGTSGQSLRLEALEIKIVEKQRKCRLYIDEPANGNVFDISETSKIKVQGWKMANASNTYIKAYMDNTEVDSSAISYYNRTDVTSAIKDFGTAEQNPQAGFKFEIDASNITIGNHTIKIEAYYKEKLLETQSQTISVSADPHIKYSSHVQYIGWQDWKKDGETSGTTGQEKRVEALKLQLTNVESTAHIKYKVHVQDIGWMDWKKDGEIAGTTGQEKRIEAIKVELEGLDGYTVEYRAHVQYKGWQSWSSNGMIAGTIGQSLRIEALQVRIVKNEDTVVPQIKYSSYNTKNSWSEYYKNGVTAGNENSGLKLEALKMSLENISVANVQYKVHVENVGWMDYVQDGAQAGTTGQNNGIEAIRINLKGMDGYSVEYRAYIIGQGWQDWVRDNEMAGTTGKSKQIGAIQIRLNIKAYVSKKERFDIDSIDTSRYPGYKERISALMDAHPNWDFKLLYTGLTFDEVIKGEYSVHSRNLVPSNYSGEWICSVCGTKLYDSGWYCTSEKAIAYYMDSRNFLDDTNVFQFLDLNEYTEDSVSLNGIQSKVNGTFLASYAEAVNNACKNTNVNPYYIIARLLQEQGSKGTAIGTGMNGGDGRTYYNPFNIGASGNGQSEIYANALATAKSYGWDSMQKAIEGGISFCKKYWLENYQNTLYQNKFDIDSTNGTSLYTHQYMQNLMAAYSESLTLRSMYANTGKIDSEFTFIIPVYERMSGTLSAKPANNSESTIINVKVVADGGLNIRKGASTDSSVIKTVANGEVILSVQRGINSNWQKVVLNDGTIGYMNGTYLQQVADVTNCNYSAYVKTSDGTGCNIRVGPSTSLDKITALADGTRVTVINEGTYNNINGFNWVRIILTDGRQAFMPSNYLRR